MSVGGMRKSVGIPQLSARRETSGAEPVKKKNMPLPITNEKFQG